MWHVEQTVFVIACLSRLWTNSLWRKPRCGRLPRNRSSLWSWVNYKLRHGSWSWPWVNYKHSENKSGSGVLQLKVLARGSNITSSDPAKERRRKVEQTKSTSCKAQRSTIEDSERRKMEMGGQGLPFEDLILLAHHRLRLLSVPFAFLCNDCWLCRMWTRVWMFVEIPYLEPVQWTPIGP